MSAVEPLFSHHAATDVLKNLFSPTQTPQAGGEIKDVFKEKAEKLRDSLSGSNGKNGSDTQDGSKMSAVSEAATGQSTLSSGSGSGSGSVADQAPSTTPDSQEDQDEQDLPQAEAKEISAEPSDNVHVDHFITQPQQSDDNDQVTKADLVRVLESFVTAIRETTERHDPNVHTNLPSPLNFEPHVAESMVEMIESKNVEIDELKSLLVEAQSTIITLLTDRVDDKAKIATFESQMRYLPDYERLHAQPGELRSQDSEELRADLTKVKAELQVIKNTAFKSSLDKPAKWTGLKAWLSKFVAPTNA